MNCSLNLIFNGRYCWKMELIWSNSCLIADHYGMCPDIYNRARFAPSQWEAALLGNAVSHWLGAKLESALYKELFCDLQNGDFLWKFVYRMFPENFCLIWKICGQPTSYKENNRLPTYCLISTLFSCCNAIYMLHNAVHVLIESTMLAWLLLKVWHLFGARASAVMPI